MKAPEGPPDGGTGVRPLWRGGAVDLLVWSRSGFWTFFQEWSYRLSLCPS